MKLILLQGVFLSLVSIVSAQLLYQEWSDNDLQQWLKENGIQFKPKDSRSKLLKTIDQNWSKIAGSPYADWSVEKLGAYANAKGIELSESAQKSKKDLINSLTSVYDQSSEWLFDSWSEVQLKAFLDANKIKYSAKSDFSELKEEAKSLLNFLNEKSKTYSSFSGSWIYDQWSKSDLQNWLKSHGEDVKKTLDREALIAKVRSKSYADYVSESASSLISKAKESADNGAKEAQNKLENIKESVVESTADGYNALLDKLVFAKQAVIDSSGKVLDSIVDYWDESSIRNWATTKGLNNIPETFSKDSIASFFKEHGSLLAQDIQKRRLELTGKASEYVNYAGQKVLGTPEPPSYWARFKNNLKIRNWKLFHEDL